MNSKNSILALGSLIAISASGWYLWNYHFTAPKINVALHQGIGEALANETIESLNNRGDIFVITMAEQDSDILAEQFSAFRARIAQAGGIRIKDVEFIDSDKKAKYGPGIGLSARKLAREVKKNSDQSAIISFVGLPMLDDAEFAELGEVVPPLLALARDAKKLGPLAQRGLIQSVIVPRFTFPTPGPESPRTPSEWFTNQYQVVRLTKITPNP